MKLRHFPATYALIVLTAALASSACSSGLISSSPVRSQIYVSTLRHPSATLSEPFGLASREGDIYVSDGQAGSVVKISADGNSTVVASGFHTPSAIAFGPDATLYVVDSGRHTLYRVDDGSPVLVAGGQDLSGRADGSAADARFHAPIGLAVADDGRIFIADTYNDRICVVKDNVVTTLAGGIQGYADGLGAAARFDTPVGLAVWGDRVLVADSGNRRIRVVENDGRVWTLAGNGAEDGGDGFPADAAFDSPSAVAVDSNGAIYVADGNAIRAIGRRSFGLVETLSGGPRGYRDGERLAATFNRPSGIVALEDGRVVVADSDNASLRIIGPNAPEGPAAKPNGFTAESFRTIQTPRWPFDPPHTPRDIAGTLGEIRGELKDDSSRVWFHNGLDIAGAYGERTMFIRDEKVLDPNSAENFGTLRELLRLPAIGYIHVRLGRDAVERAFEDPRFIFSRDAAGRFVGVRVPRGAEFKAGEAVGTLNAMNHVHLIAGPSGGEMNALDALELPRVSDGIKPIIEDVKFFDEAWREIETPAAGGRIKLTGKTRVVVRAFDRMDGNPERRRLGVYRAGYELLTQDGQTVPGAGSEIRFDLNPPSEAVRIVYAPGSVSGPRGPTFFDYIVTNRLTSSGYSEGFIDPQLTGPGSFRIAVSAGDRFGNVAIRTIDIEVTTQ